MRLEGITGTELYRKLKKRLPPEVKYYAITAQVLPSEQQAVLDQGFEDIIIKPFTADDLLNLFREPASDEGITFNETALHKMTMGDQQLISKILVGFTADCEADYSTISKMMIKGDLSGLRLIIHRLAGRIGQIGANDLGLAFRKLEMDIDQAEQLDEGLKTKVSVCLQQLQWLLTAIRPHLYSR
ncbi:hypothetical protein D9M68_691150 [compost metagenome]